jgi:hypothetical protein
VSMAGAVGWGWSSTVGLKMLTAFMKGGAAEWSRRSRRRTNEGSNGRSHGPWPGEKGGSLSASDWVGECTNCKLHPQPFLHHHPSASKMPCFAFGFLLAWCLDSWLPANLPCFTSTTDCLRSTRARLHKESIHPVDSPL